MLSSTAIIRCFPSPFQPAFSVSAVSTTPPRLLLEWITVPRSVTSPVWLTSPVPTPMNASIPGFAPEMPVCFHVKSRYLPHLLSLSHRAFVPAVVYRLSPPAPVRMTRLMRLMQSSVL